MYTSTTDELRENNIEELLQLYYYEVKDLLIKLGHDMKGLPTLQAFQMEISSKFFFGEFKNQKYNDFFIIDLFPLYSALASGFLIFPVMIGQDKDANFEILMGTDEKAMNFKRKLFKDPRMQKVVKMLLPKFDAKGLLDPM